jgi:hypothetical protein
MFKLACVVAIVTLLPPASFAASDEPSRSANDRSPRVRPSDSRATSLVLQGLERSETLRYLVNQLEQRDVLVYVEMQPTLKKRLAGALTWMTATKMHRYVRVSINPELHKDAAIATLGHELQHALEVANAPEIVDATTLQAYYEKNGNSNQAHVKGWDTEAARVAGEDVRRELAGIRVSRVAESIQPFDPDDWQVVYRRARGMLPP